MKHFYLLLVAIFFSVNIQAQNAPFITTWEVTAGDLGISIPTIGTGYNYTVDFGDGTVQNNVMGFANHIYNNPGVYTVSITGDFPRIVFQNSIPSNQTKILSVEQWGDNEWKSMNGAFYGCSSLIINAIDAPDLSQVTSLTQMFYDATFLNQSIDHWNVSNVTNMQGMFRNATSFNQPLSNWNVSNVSNMQEMFRNATSFNQPLSSWDVSNVTNIESMFVNATSFNQTLNSWDVSKITDMRQVFINATSFNQPLNNWDVSNVTHMGWMFLYATSFNQSLNNWDVSNVVSMTQMFESATSFNQPLNNWNTSSLVNMGNMFRDAVSFNQPLDTWDVSNVGFMANMFYGASMFNQDISSWDFNPSVFLHDWELNESNFFSNSSINVQNYDALLERFVQLGLQNKKLGANGLYYCNLADRNYLINVLGWTITGDNFDFNGCPFNTVHGNILYDLNNNGCDPNDIAAENIIINANDGTNYYATISDSNGDYTIYLLDDTYTISLLNLPGYFATTPASSTVNFVGFNNVQVVDFCLTATQPIEDINITLLPTSEARPGFEAKYRLVVKNVGTETIANVVATLQFDDTMQQFVVASPSPGSTTTNTLTFPIGSMQPFQSFKADITMQTFPPQTVMGGDILNFTAEVTPSANDHTPNDNIYNLAQIVVNSYDPNDKQVLQGEELHIDDVNEYLDYLIRFQNSGTASAIHVRILDTLHPKLDWSTLKPISASHEYYVQITDGNKVEFKFDNIYLPHEDDDEPGSHGFIAYKIKLKSNVQVGDIISGDAAIYFDFNDPIITNMVHTQIVDPPLGLEDNPNPLNNITVYPNPTNKTLHIFLTDNIQLEEVSIYDLQGKEVQKFQGKEKTLNVENLSPGMYFLKITTDRGVVNRKLVKD